MNEKTNLIKQTLKVSRLAYRMHELAISDCWEPSFFVAFVVSFLALKKKVWSNPFYFIEESLCRYKIKVKTSDLKFAGTDANVFIELYGKQFKTGLLTSLILTALWFKYKYSF